MQQADIIVDLKRFYHLSKRRFWYCFYYCFAQHLPTSFRYQPLGKFGKFCRALACSRLFRACGQGVNVEHRAYFESGWEIEIGNYSGLGINCSVPFDLKIGDDVMMGPEVLIIGDNHRFDDLTVPIRLQGNAQSRPVRIEDDVWIGARVTILPGLTIGRGAVIGVGAVVTKDVPPYAICAGNPARVIRYRTDAALGLEQAITTGKRSL